MRYRYSECIEIQEMRVYLDYNATTPMDRGVLEAMLPYCMEDFGNASSIHSAGQRARAAVERARESVATLLDAKPSEIVFTSGGTESDNLALLGIVAATEGGEKHIITTSIEHRGVLSACETLERQGAEVTYVPVSREGIVDPEDIRAALRPQTVLISVMHANNELGTIQPAEEIGRIAREAGICFHCDAIQSVGKLPVNVDLLNVNLLSLSAHKMYGPKGVGALYIREGTQIEPQLHGGHRKRDRPPGTENVPGIVGFGMAAEVARMRVMEDAVRISELRDRFEETLLESVPGVFINGDRRSRVANTTNLTFAAAGGEALVIALDLQGIACSTGAACSSGATEPSHVLTAMGLSIEEARSSLRFSLGRATTAEEIDHAMTVIPGVVGRLRALSPVSAAAVTTR
jgi:cysteine desulfurase